MKKRLVSSLLLTLFVLGSSSAFAVQQDRVRGRERDFPKLIKVIKKIFGISTNEDSGTPPKP